MLDASSVGMLNCIVKYKNRLIFYYEVEKRTKKNTRVDFFLASTSFLLVMMTPVVCHTLFPLRTDQSLMADRLL